MHKISLWTNNMEMDVQNTQGTIQTIAWDKM